MGGIHVVVGNGVEGGPYQCVGSGAGVVTSVVGRRYYGGTPGVLRAVKGFVHGNETG